MVKAKRVRWPDRSAGWYGIAGVVIVLDQASKWLVLAMILPGEVIELTPFWNWVLTFNAGAAFSFLADQAGWQRWFFTLLALAVSGWLAREIQRHATLPRLALAMALVMGGALGNVIDRLRFGAVVDFVQWHVAGYFWPAFNVADAAITVGAVLLVIGQLTVETSHKDS